MVSKTERLILEGIDYLITTLIPVGDCSEIHCKIEETLNPKQEDKDGD